MRFPTNVTILLLNLLHIVYYIFLAPPLFFLRLQGLHLAPCTCQATSIYSTELSPRPIFLIFCIWDRVALCTSIHSDHPVSVHRPHPSTGIAGMCHHGWFQCLVASWASAACGTRDRTQVLGLAR